VLCTAQPEAGLCYIIGKTLSYVRNEDTGHQNNSAHHQWDTGSV